MLPILGEQVLRQFRNVMGAQFLGYFFRPLYHAVWHAGQFCYLDAVALVCAPWHDFAQKHNIIAFFLHGNAVIIYIVELPFQFCQLMVMGGE